MNEAELPERLGTCLLVAGDLDDERRCCCRRCRCRLLRAMNTSRAQLLLSFLFHVLIGISPSSRGTERPVQSGRIFQSACFLLVYPSLSDALSELDSQSDRQTLDRVGSTELRTFLPFMRTNLM